MTCPKTWKEKMSPAIPSVRVPLLAKIEHTMLLRELSIFEPGELLWDIKEIADEGKWSWTGRVREPPSLLIDTNDQECGS